MNKQFCIMQCNTNYTAENDNFNYLNLNVLKAYKKISGIVLVADHTPGHSSVLGAIALGARMVENIY